MRLLYFTKIIMCNNITIGGEHYDKQNIILSIN